ncbi:hypothetical protein [Marinomonas mediterranea]|uniref:Lipoprotein n=1 Tax=Marinomonas mediterranea (strain ATCC 700492 / JCM 21426 / NBRC 103028 / MMB-1) TaxID=717774 RepID=F2JUE0_MARM1|nr:hypothetical protein [Marinomonas mediterranea]ADZ92759.1 hypothetical protein Marme_3546 [Marinomonas mediterranea MMB-1]WCN10688.1 hypothetical protein GV055_18035 [Marinomonas mediterranea]WCN14745.1 hypothetical protein GV054_17910 [Marinomonas mediterranea]WCN18786.1 hypothetical protein GV053_17940 [Marinomonas mediterranea MMB-1]
MFSFGRKANENAVTKGQWLKCISAFLAVLLLSACSSSAHKSNFEEKRKETQVALSEKLESLWERAHIIPDLQRGAPLVSHSERGQNAILQQNAANLQLADGLLASLNKRVLDRKSDGKKGDRIRLTLVLASDKNQMAFSADPIEVWRGDVSEWVLSSPAGERLSVRVVWNEQGPLYLEGQQTADVSLAMPSTPFITNLFYYGNAVTAQKALSLLLSVDVNIK